MLLASGIILVGLVVVAINITRSVDESMQLNDIGVQDFDTATRIKIRYITTSPQQELIIDDPEKIKFAIEFINKYPNDWREPTFVARVGAPVFVEFFNKDKLLGAYGVGPQHLTYNLTHIRTFHEGENPKELFEGLDIPLSSEFSSS